MRPKFAIIALTAAILVFLPRTVAAEFSRVYSLPVITLPVSTLEKGESYRSQYIDVRAYRQLTFYVTNAQDPHTTSDPRTTNTLTVKCKLDAFFSFKNTGTTVLKWGESNPQQIDNLGSQDFGYSDSDSSDLAHRHVVHTGTELDPGAFQLSIPVFGPFVRVELRNLSEHTEDFQILVYAT